MVRELSVDVQARRLDPEHVAGRAGQPLDVVFGMDRGVQLGPLFGGDVHRIENKNVPAPGQPEVVGEFVDEHLVAGVDVAVRDGRARLVGLAQVDAEAVLAHVMRQRVRRGVDGIDAPAGTVDFRVVEEAETFGGHQLDHLVVHRGNHVDIGAAEPQTRAQFSQRTGGSLADRRGMPDDAVEGRLHRTGRNLEGLDEIGANGNRQHEGDQQHLAILPPAGLVVRRLQLAEALVQILDGRLHPLAVRRAAVARGRFQFVDLRRVLAVLHVAQQVPLAVQELARVEHEQLGFLDVGGAGKGFQHTVAGMRRAE